MFRKFLILVFVLIGSVAIVSAQTDPTTSEDANACYEGGTLEGKCTLDFDGDGVVTQSEIDWSWECGWYLVRIETGTGAFLPERCASLVGDLDITGFCVVDLAGLNLFSPFSGQFAVGFDVWFTAGTADIFDGPNNGFVEWIPQNVVDYPACGNIFGTPS